MNDANTTNELLLEAVFHQKKDWNTAPTNLLNNAPALRSRFPSKEGLKQDVGNIKVVELKA